MKSVRNSTGKWQDRRYDTPDRHMTDLATFDADALAGIRAEAERLEIPWEALAAVALVESGGRPLWDGLCPIRIEGHYFDRRLEGETREAARASGLSSPEPGEIANPRSMVERYAQLADMMHLDPDAAIESCSWGLGQVMGAHWEKLGYPSARALAEEAQSGVAGQVRLMCRFIETQGLADALRRRDWPSFAAAYNGSGYAAQDYDGKMARAYEAFCGIA
jgi:hypothetical protein